LVFTCGSSRKLHVHLTLLLDGPVLLGFARVDLCLFFWTHAVPRRRHHDRIVKLNTVKLSENAAIDAPAGVARGLENGRASRNSSRS
jgi:hypothetical protein